MVQQKWYRTKDVLEQVQISRNTLFLWLKKGKIPEVARDRNGHRIFTISDIRKILEYKNRTIQPQDFRKRG